MSIRRKILLYESPQLQNYVSTREMMENFDN